MSMSDRTANTLKRLHSLTGVLPIGAFLAFHLFINAKAVQGPASYRAATDEIAKLPFVALIEVVAIGLPILFHMVLGLLIVTSGQANLGRFRYERNWGYGLQRASGLFLVLFIIYHVWSSRFAPEAMSPGGDLFALMQKQLSNPAVFLFYVLGVASAAFHLGNGLFGFAIHWGLTTGRHAQRQAARFGYAVAIVLTLIGVNALLGFVGRGVRLFERVSDTANVAQTEVRP